MCDSFSAQVKRQQPHTVLTVRDNKQPWYRIAEPDVAADEELLAFTLLRRAH